MTISLFIVEDHAVMRETLRDYLLLAPDIELCGMASSAESATERLDAVQPDVVLVDLSLPGRSGLDLIEEVRDRWGVPCVVLSGHGEKSHVGRAFAAGARGYLLKGSPHEIAPALRRVLEGDIYLSDDLRAKLDHEVETSGT